MKKLLSMILALIMVLGMAVPAMAEEPVAPSSAETTSDTTDPVRTFTVTYADPFDNFEKQVYTVKEGDPVPAFQGTPERAGYAFSTWNGVYENVTDPTKETVTKDRLFNARWTALPADLDLATAKSKVALRITDGNRFNGNYDLRSEDLIDGTYTVGATTYDAAKRELRATVTVNKADLEKYGKVLSDVEGYTYHFSALGDRAEADKDGNLVIHLRNGGRYKGESKKANLALWFGGWLLDYNYYPGASRPQLIFDRYYTVTYTDGANGAAFADVALEAKENGATPAFTGNLDNYAGHAFVAWTPALAEKVTGNATYTATWEEKAVEKVTVTYTDGVNGEAFPNEVYEVTAGDPTPAFAGSTDNYTGWVFTGWNPKVADTATETVTYTAKWRMKGANTLYYYANGGAKADGSETYSMYTNAAYITVRSNAYSNFVREGYEFTGWNTKADGTGTAYKAGDAYNFEYAHNLEKGELYAQWKKVTATVTYTDGVNGEAFATETYTVKIGDPTPAFTGSFDNYSGFKFRTWSPKVAATVTDDVTYTAQWANKGANTLYYYGNGGAKADGSETYSMYTNAAYITVRSNGYPQFVRDEYKFIGWNTQADGTGTAYKAGDAYNFEYAHNLEKGYLYAQWEHVGCDKHLEDIKVIKKPTCTETGLKLCRCTVCGKELEVEMPSLGHVLSNWTWNRTDHWKKCRRCGELFDIENHNFTDWRDILDSKAKPTGTEERHCVVCGYEQHSQTIRIDGTKPGVEVNPSTGAEVR